MLEKIFGSIGDSDGVIQILYNWNERLASWNHQTTT